jgi:antitoxin component YwqK of YwqJK toxin-antitoxin module
MEIEVTDGLNIVSVGLSDIGSYFRHVYPVTVSWADCRGSVGRYMSMLPYEPELRGELQQTILANLSNDYTEKEGELHEILQPLFRLFPNGKYHLGFINKSDPYYLQYQTSSDNFTETHTHSWYISTPPVVIIADEEKVKKGHKKFLKEIDRKKYYPSNLLDYTTGNSYDADLFVLYATRPQEELDTDRVAYFENEIKNGARPFAITMSSTCPAKDLDSEEFILDGHHKLAAYQNLGITPALARIVFIAEKETLGFDAELLIDRLFPWQVEHIIANWQDKLYFMDEQLKDPQSKLHRFIKNGYYKEKHENGKRKNEAFYINDKVEGVSKGWYDSGEKQYEYRFINGKRAGTWTDWHPNGQIAYMQQFNNAGQYDKELISYYDNGRVRWRQVFNNGTNIDGPSYQSWQQNGLMEAELVYKDGRMIERKNYDGDGHMRNHERYDEQLGTLVKLPIEQRYYHAEKKEQEPAGQKKTFSHIYQKYDPYEDTGDGAGWHYTWKHLVYLIILLLWLLALLAR